MLLQHINLQEAGEQALHLETVAKILHRVVLRLTYFVMEQFLEKCFVEIYVYIFDCVVGQSRDETFSRTVPAYNIVVYSNFSVKYNTPRKFV